MGYLYLINYESNSVDLTAYMFLELSLNWGLITFFSHIKLSCILISGSSVWNMFTFKATFLLRDVTCIVWFYFFEKSCFQVTFFISPLFWRFGFWCFYTYKKQWMFFIKFLLELSHADLSRNCFLGRDWASILFSNITLEGLLLFYFTRRMS